jgi:hypothetical protein
MKDTCLKEKCHLWDLFDQKNCPNYCESFWKPEDTNQQKLVCDCAPRRTMLMIQDIFNRIICMQQSQEQSRNEAVWVQVVAEVLGKNSGIDLGAFVAKRQKIMELGKIKKESLKIQ